MKNQTQNIPDEINAKVEDLLNKTIHELVFAIAASDADDPEDSLTCLVQAHLNIEAVSDMLEELVPGKVSHNRN